MSEKLSMADFSILSSNYINASKLEYPDQSPDTLKSEDNDGPKTLKGPKSLEEMYAADHCPLGDHRRREEMDSQRQPDLTDIALSTLRISICISSHEEGSCHCVDKLVTQYKRAMHSGSAICRKELLEQIILSYLTNRAWKDASDYLLQLLKLEQDTTGKQQGTTLFNLGLCYKNLKNYEEAQTYFKLALPEIEKYRGNSHPLLALCFQQIGVSCFFNNNFKKAVDYFASAFHIWNICDDRDCQRLERADVLHMLGHCYFELKCYKEAFRYFRTELTILENDSSIASHDIHPLTYAHRLQMCGECCYKLGQSLGVSLFKRWSDLVEQYFEPLSFNTYKECCFRSVANAANRFNQIDLALEYANKLLQCAQGHYGEHSDSAVLRDAQTLVDEVLKKYQKALRKE